MDINRLLPVLLDIKGCTFASLDSSTVSQGVRRETTNEQVMLFSMKDGSGYGNKVRRELEKCGRDPDSFRLGPLPWGDRVEGLPLIDCKGVLYLQTILLSPGESRYFIGVKEVPRPSWLRSRVAVGQGLPEGREVVVNTYKLDNITGIRLKGQVL